MLNQHSIINFSFTRFQSKENMKQNMNANIIILLISCLGVMNSLGQQNATTEIDLENSNETSSTNTTTTTTTSSSSSTTTTTTTTTTTPPLPPKEFNYSSYKLGPHCTCDLTVWRLRY